MYTIYTTSYIVGWIHTEQIIIFGHTFDYKFRWVWVGSTKYEADTCCVYLQWKKKYK